MNTGTRHYAIVTAAYWGFTLSDGALRMLVLLHFYRLGYSPFTLAFLFLLYEAMGVVANLVGGWLATRYGIQRMLVVGLATQITGFLLLSALSPGWSCRPMKTRALARTPSSKPSWQLHSSGKKALPKAMCWCSHRARPGCLWKVKVAHEKTSLRWLVPWAGA